MKLPHLCCAVGKPSNAQMESSHIKTYCENFYAIHGEEEDEESPNTDN